MKKKLILGLMALLLVAALPLSAACEEEQEVYNLVFNDHNPPGSGPALAMDVWAENVMAESEGRLEIEIIHGGGLFAGDEVYRAVETGACDGGHYVADRAEGFLLSTIMALPFMGWPEQHVEEAYQTLLDEFDEMADEWEGVTIIAFMFMPPTHIHTSGAVIEKPEDLQGLKMMGAEAILVETLNEMGATGIAFDIMDMTPSVETNLIQGVMNHFPVLNVFGTLELLTSHTVFGDGGINISPMFLIMNTEVLESLPGKLEDIILNSSDYWFNEFKKNDDADIEFCWTYCEENNHTMVYLTPAEIQDWYDLVRASIHQAWIDEAEDAGLPGQELYDRALELIEEMS